ncbi:MAG: endonuclease/exonuclease/phosphatase family protein, partial [Myxococcales bacterium]|nr:endonuclease/exonuclease/phosphatase family protein [Myxococcales bacterium]
FRENIFTSSSACYVRDASSARDLQACLSSVSPVVRIQDSAFRGCASSDTTCDGRDDDCNGLVDDQCTMPAGPAVMVPRSDTCNQGVMPLDSVNVPPRATASFATDGIRSPEEYWGAVELPLPSAMARGGRGRVYATVDQSRRLRLFFDEVVLPQPPPPVYTRPLPPPATPISVVIDYDRWAADPATLRDTDRLYSATVERGERSMRRAVSLGGVTRWESIAVDSSFQAATGGCVDGGPGLRRCSLEMSIVLPPSAFAPPASGLLPGIGIAIVDADGQAAVPEELVVGPTDLSTALLDRTKQVSLVFGRPEGVPFTFLTWNLARWGEGAERALAGGTFEHLPLSEHADLIWEYDIVALQEVWQISDAEELLALVNERRSAAGLEPWHLVGPAAPPASFFREMGGALLGDHHAGIFIMTKFPAIGRDHVVYSSCVGEDCLKPKGAQWVRLALRTPDARDLSPDCAPPTSRWPACTTPACPSGPVRRHVSCPSAPTTEMYVDVFNTHLQARNPTICQLSDTELAAVWAGLLAQCGSPEIPLVPAPVVCAAAITALQANTAFCGLRTPEEVTASQLRELGEFVDRVVGERRDQPALIAGDFNVDGRRLLSPSGSVRNPLYGAILDELRITPPESTTPADDTITPYPNVFPWAIDHGDVAREESQYDWSSCGHGTSIGKRLKSRDWRADGTDVVDGCSTWSCDNVEDDRLDYILIRPPAHPTESDDPPGYLLTRSEGTIWEPLFPSNADANEHLCALADFRYRTPWGYDGTSTTGRLSDHRPVVARFELTPLRIPGRYHRGVDHTLDIRVASMDASGTTDCMGNLCRPLDPYVMLAGEALAPGSTTPVAAPARNQRAICSGWSLSTADGPCIDDWSYTTPVPAGSSLEHALTIELWDDDLADRRTGSDDHLKTMNPGRDPRFVVDWRTGTWDVRVAQTGEAPDGWEGPMPFFSSDPVCHQTRLEKPNLVVCIATE